MSNSFPTPANQANPVLAEHAAEIRRLGKRVVGDVIEIGARLTECKRICGHGNWLPWLNREFGWTDKTAERFMSVHALSGKFENLSDLELPISGLYLLAAPSTPETARTDIIKRAQSGEVIQLPEVKRTIDAAKGKQPVKRAVARKKATDPPPQVSEEVLQEREQAAERMRGLMGRSTRDDVGSGSSGEGIDADTSMLGILLKAWDLAPEISRQKFMARVGLIPDPLAIPPYLDRRTREAVP